MKDNMKYLKTFENLEKDLDYHWEEVMKSVDVYQLYEILLFKYGKGFLLDTEQAIKEEEGDYNPEHIYDIIKYEMEQKGVFEDFVKNFDKYKIEKDGNDPFHWRYRKKQQDELFKNWDKEL